MTAPRIRLSLRLAWALAEHCRPISAYTHQWASVRGAAWNRSLPRCQ
jgi:hypothetical protein